MLGPQLADFSCRYQIFHGAVAVLSTQAFKAHACVDSLHEGASTATICDALVPGQLTSADYFKSLLNLIFTDHLWGNHTLCYAEWPNACVEGKRLSAVKSQRLVVFKLFVQLP